jgi:hypothetical protein
MCRDFNHTHPSAKYYGISKVCRRLDQLIRLKVNRQIYDGQLDPSGHHIRLIPIQQVPVKYY